MDLYGGTIKYAIYISCALFNGHFVLNNIKDNSDINIVNNFGEIETIHNSAYKKGPALYINNIYPIYMLLSVL